MGSALKEIPDRLNFSMKTRGEAAGLDLLAEVLSNTSTGGVLFAHSWIAPPWGLRFEEARYWGFHMVSHGRCCARVDGGEVLRLEAGDIVLVGGAHDLMDAPGRAVIPFTDFDHDGVAVGPEDPEAVGLLCGAYDFEAEASHPLFSSLPPVIHIPARERPAEVATVAELILREWAADAPGAVTLAERLMDALFVYILRHWLHHEGSKCGGWLGALRQPPLARAIALMHHAPERPWTVATLARAVGMSRATFARHFQAEVGVSPMHYLAQWRMGRARHLVRGSDAPLDAIAGQLGYATGFSLSRAYKRAFGVPPGRDRIVYQGEHRDGQPRYAEV